jgi:hypothetical protein
MLLLSFRRRLTNPPKIAVDRLGHHANIIYTSHLSFLIKMAAGRARFTAGPGQSNFFGCHFLTMALSLQTQKGSGPIRFH